MQEYIEFFQQNMILVFSLGWSFAAFDHEHREISDSRIQRDRNVPAEVTTHYEP